MSIEPDTDLSCVSTGYRHSAVPLISPRTGIQDCMYGGKQFFLQMEKENLDCQTYRGYNCLCFMCVCTRVSAYIPCVHVQCTFNSVE